LPFDGWLWGAGRVPGVPSNGVAGRIKSSILLYQARQSPSQSKSKWYNISLNYHGKKRHELRDGVFAIR
jgi:hypothetical protein